MTPKSSRYRCSSHTSCSGVFFEDPMIFPSGLLPDFQQFHNLVVSNARPPPFERTAQRVRVKLPCNSLDCAYNYILARSLLLEVVQNLHLLTSLFACSTLSNHCLCSTLPFRSTFTPTSIATSHGLDALAVSAVISKEPRARVRDKDSSCLRAFEI